MQQQNKPTRCGHKTTQTQKDVTAGLYTPHKDLTHALIRSSIIGSYSTNGIITLSRKSQTATDCCNTLIQPHLLRDRAAENHEINTCATFKITECKDKAIALKT